MRTGKLTLPNVTLIAIDAHRPRRTMVAMLEAMRQVTFAEAILVTAPGQMNQYRNQLQGIRVVECTEPILVGPPDFRGIRTAIRKRREEIMVSQLYRFFSTSHCLNMEWDSCVGNPAAWKDDWLALDLIGAPWPWPYTEPNCPIPCTADNCVGNTGFALMSRTLCETSGKIGKPSDTDLLVSDAYLCRTIRPALEAYGCRFANQATAEAFSCENRIYSGQFGWHGQYTIKMNGWQPANLTL